MSECETKFSLTLMHDTRSDTLGCKCNTNEVLRQVFVLTSFFTTGRDVSKANNCGGDDDDNL